MLRRFADLIRHWRFPGWPQALLYAVVLPIVALTPACAGSFEEARATSALKTAPARTPERCAALDDRRQLFGGAGKTLAVLGGGAGLATVATDNEDLRTGLALGSVSAGALAAGSIFVSESAGTTWAAECAAP